MASVRREGVIKNNPGQLSVPVTVTSTRSVKLGRSRSAPTAESQLCGALAGPGRARLPASRTVHSSRPRRNAAFILLHIQMGPRHIWASLC